MKKWAQKKAAYIAINTCQNEEMSSEAVNIIINMYLDVEMSSANTDFIVINTCLYEEMSIENVVSTVVYNKINIHERITDDAFNQISLNHTRTICKGYIESCYF